MERGFERLEVTSRAESVPGGGRESEKKKKMCHEVLLLPPADKAVHWTIHQRANQTDLEQRREPRLQPAAATDWPDLSRCHRSLISRSSIKGGFLPG